MPQFDFTTYSSQVFWLVICFIILYICSYKLILPRIRDILQVRANAIGADLLAANELASRINHLQIKTDILRKEAAASYQAQLDSVTKSCNIQKDKATEELKVKVEGIAKKSGQEIENFISQSKAKRDAAVKALVTIIKTKILKV